MGDSCHPWTTSTRMLIDMVQVFLGYYLQTITEYSEECILMLALLGTLC